MNLQPSVAGEWRSLTFFARNRFFLFEPSNCSRHTIASSELIGVAHLNTRGLFNMAPAT